MKMRIMKLLFLPFIWMIMALNVIAAPAVGNVGSEKAEKNWKMKEIRPDLDNDGKKDKIVVEYVIENDKVITVFTPYITNEGNNLVKGKATEKTFNKSTFTDDFDTFFNEFVRNYPKKERKASTSQPLNPKEEKQDTSRKQEESVKAVTEEKNPVPEDIKENNIKAVQEAIAREEEKKQENDGKVSSIGTENKISGQVKGPYEYIVYYVKERPKNLTFNYKYDKNSFKDMDDFIFVKTSTNVRKEPNTASPIIKTAAYASKYKVIGKIKSGDAEWYEIQIDGKIAYIIASNALKREFDWNDMMNKAGKTNKFIKDALSKNSKIYVLDDYTPLGGGEGGNKDKYGNRENQSERGYLGPDFKEFINIPDRSLMTITEETDRYIKVKIDVYDGKEYYLKKSNRSVLKDSKITGEVTRFIYVDRNSQNEIIIEKNKDLESWNVVTSSFVTTGKDGGDSYATPYGVFLIAYSKPVMQYVGSDGKTVAGDAKNAVRFSGGGYMHSIPSLFEPKATREDRKAITAKKIGTYPESHKCIRHYDDQIKFIYDWLGNSSPGDKNGFRVPEVSTIMLVK